MKGVLLFLLAAAMTFTCKAQTSFGLNKTVSIDAGYDYVHSFNTKYDFAKFPRHLLALDFTCYGIYVGGVIMGDCQHDFSATGSSADVDYCHLDFNTLGFKFGPSFYLGNRRNRLIVTPHAGWLYHRDQNKRSSFNHFYTGKKSRFLAGVKLMYAHRNFEFGANVSNLDAGASIGYNIGGNWHGKK